MTSLVDLLAASRAYAYRLAVVEKLKVAFPGVEVKGLRGKLDIADFDQADMFQPPSLGVAIARIRPAEARLSDQRDVPVETVVYVVAEDMPVGPEQRLTYRDEIGLALCDGLLAFLETPEARWGLNDIGMPEDAEARAIVNVSTENRGTAYLAVTWWQMLYGQGQPFMDMEGAVPADASASVLLPGDPGWAPPAGSAP